MRFVMPFLALVILAHAAIAETVRVAVVRGSSLQIEGRSLLVRESPGGKGVAVKASLDVDLVGPFVSTGNVLAPVLYVSDGAGNLTINGVVLAGSAEITPDKGMLVAVDVVDLEQYVATVVSSEMPPDWPPAALEAQAIATRTYVLQKQEAASPDAPYDVESTVISQVYRGPESMDPAALAAARKTAGEVLAFGGHVLEAYFFSSCAGTTETSLNAFGHVEPYLKAVSCHLNASDVSWSRRVPLTMASRLFQAAGFLRGRVKSLSVEMRTSTGRVKWARIRGATGGRRISGADLRRALGYRTLPSLDFSVSTRGGVLAFSGRGAGHGVGLCQWCARSMAVEGQTSTEILKHFYPGAVIEQMSTVLLADRP